MHVFTHLLIGDLISKVILIAEVESFIKSKKSGYFIIIFTTKIYLN